MSQGVVDLFNQLAKNDFGFFQRIGSVADLMTRDVVTLTLDDTFDDAVALFEKSPFHHAPVIDAEKGDVVGIVSDRDILRYRPPQLGSAADPSKNHPALSVPVSQFMTRGLISAGVDATPEAALSLMLDHHVDSVLIHDDARQLEGIITVRDFMKMVLLFHQVCTSTPDLVRLRLVDLDMSRGLPLDFVFSRGARSVRDVMTREFETLRPTDSIGHAMERMQTLEVRHLPVVEADGRVVGLLTDRDVLRHLPLPVPRLDKVTKLRFRERLFATQATEVLQQKVASIMGEAPPSVRPDALFVDTITAMLSRDLSAMPVLDNHDDRICGIFTTTDIARVLRVAFRIGGLVKAEG